MPVVTASRPVNLAFWLTLLGLLLVAASLWLPVAAAERTARVEGRADRLAALLLATANSMQPLRQDPLEREVLLARFLRLASARGERVEDLERLPDAAPTTWLLLQNRHYLLQLTVSPPDPRADPPSRDSVPALEVLAWPRARGGPARTAFFHPETAEAAYSRNLVMGYQGLGTGRPQPGRSHRRPGGLFDAPFSYRSYDDERWLLSHRPPAWSRARLRAPGS